MAWNMAYWCILTASRNYAILASIDPVLDFWWPKEFIEIEVYGSWPPSEIIQFEPVLVLWCPQNLVNLGVLGIVRRMHGRNKCDMLIYPDLLQPVKFWPVLVQFQPSWYHTSQVLMWMHTFVLIMTNISCISDESIIDLIVLFHNDFFP